MSLEVTVRGEKPFPGFKLNAGNFFFQIPHVLIRVKMYIWYLQDTLVRRTFEVFVRAVTMTANPVGFSSAVDIVRIDSG